MSRVVNWGILGPGNIARKFADDCKSVSNARVLAVGSRDLNRAKLFAKEFEIETVYSDYSSLCEDTFVDAIYIATPHNFHFEHAQLALLNGKNVLCEKPISVSLREFQALDLLAKSNNLYLAEGMWTYHLPAITTALELVMANKIGELKKIKAEFGYKSNFDPKSRIFSPDLAGGVLLDIGIYVLAISYYFFRKMPSIQTRDIIYASTGVDETISIAQGYGHQTASLSASINGELSNSCILEGASGSIELPNFWEARKIILKIHGENTEVIEFPRKTFGFDYQIKNVSSNILEGKLESDIVPMEFSKTFQLLMEDLIKESTD